MLAKLIDKAAVLIEAMPFLQRFKGEIVVVKFGGSAMENPATAESILADISFMSCVGMHPVIVHGGGKAISRAMEKAGVKPKFVCGLRATDESAIGIVESVLSNEISPGIVRAIQGRGMDARVVAGTAIIRSRKHMVEDPVTREKCDLGFVGEVVSVDPRPLRDLVASGTIPVVSPLGSDMDGAVYNNNADTAAAEVAIAIGARKLVFLSDVHGIYEDPEDTATFIPSIHRDEVEALVQRKVISGGMLPKVRAGVKAIQSGVKKTHVVDGNMKHSLLLELFTEDGIGTEIIA